MYPTSSNMGAEYATADAIDRVEEYVRGNDGRWPVSDIELYGCNMNAWIDCMTSIDEPLDGLSKIHGTKEAGICLDLGDCTSFAKRCPQQYEAIVDSSAFVNYRRIATGEEPVISLSFRNQAQSRPNKKQAKQRWRI